MLCKFHSVFLSQEGCVLSCGHGPGGRLGHNTEQSIVVSMFVSMNGPNTATGYIPLMQVIMSTQLVMLTPEY